MVSESETRTESESLSFLPSVPGPALPGVRSKLDLESPLFLRLTESSKTRPSSDFSSSMYIAALSGFKGFPSEINEDRESDGWLRKVGATKGIGESVRYKDGKTGSHEFRDVPVFSEHCSSPNMFNLDCERDGFCGRLIELR